MKPLLPFNLESAVVVREPVGNSAGYWVGAPGVFVDQAAGQVYLSYRIRRPRGVEPDRGAEIQIARGTDGRQFDTIWTGTKDQLRTASIERCALWRFGAQWKLYVSYVDPLDGRWRIDQVTADAPDQFQLAGAEPLFSAAQLNVDGIKDPFLVQDGERLCLLVSFASRATEATEEQLHGTLDAYNTGLIRSATGLATSDDGGRSWQWRGEVFRTSRDGWDSYCARIGCAWRDANQQWQALYDGSRDVSENYEERVGLAVGQDLTSLRRISSDGPLVEVPVGQACRYFDTAVVGGERLFYFEAARSDGSHDLRVARGT